MKGALDRTKVVLRHLPPTISESALVEQIDGRFAGRYNWVSFRPGKNSQKQQSYSRGYVDFKRPEDVIEFAEFFDGHVFVNEKGTQCRTIVEYAPSQRVPKHSFKRDRREGTVNKDPEYLEFLEFIAKPVENLPSAEIQLERREAERAGVAKDAPIVTPLMDFVRQIRAAKGESRRPSSNGKHLRRASGASSGNHGSASSKRGSEKRRISTTMHVLRDTANNTSGKDKSMYTLVPKRDDQHISDNSISSAGASGTEVLGEESGVSGTTNIGKNKILLLKRKEREIPHMSGGRLLQQSATTRIKNSLGSATLRQNQRHEASGKIIRSILLNKDTRQSPSTSVVNSEQQIQASNQEKDQRPPRPPNVQFFLKETNGAQEVKVVGNDLHSFCSEKQEKRTRNKDRPDRSVWTTALWRSDGSYASDESLSSSTSQPTQSLLDSVEGTHGGTKNDMLNARTGEFKHIGSRLSSVDNGSHKHGGRRGSAHYVNDVDSSSMVKEGKSLKRGGSSGHGFHEKQAKAARLFSVSETFVLYGLLESELSKAFGGLERLDTFFPFDPYLLKKSERFIRPNYVYWSMVRTTCDDDDDDEDDDDEGIIGEECVGGNGVNITNDGTAMSSDEDDLDELDLQQMSITPQKNSLNYRFGGRIQMPSRIRPSTSPESL